MTEPRPRYRTKRDTNQATIKAELEQLGFLVFDISTMPDSQCPGDLIVRGWHGYHELWIWQPFEVKVPGGRLTKQQREFQEQHPDAVPVVQQAEDVVEWYMRVAE
ncbi:MAG TPA: hypothetical protein VM223_13810 [Planctomycetota bacterium]|nr:hypothetical protein [Planctomycetota bacterium]